MNGILMLMAMFQVGRFLAGYPLECSYTAKGLRPDATLGQRLSRGSVFGVVNLVIVLVYQLMYKGGSDIKMLLEVGAMTMAGHMLLDFIKSSPSLLGSLQVLSNEDLIVVETDYKSIDPAVVAAAQARADGNKMFWWGTGGMVALAGLLEVLLAYLAQ
jgi:hypothetical protein